MCPAGNITPGENYIGQIEECLDLCLGLGPYVRNELESQAHITSKRYQVQHCSQQPITASTNPPLQPPTHYRVECARAHH